MKLQKRFLAFLLAITMVLTTVISFWKPVTTKADEGLTLKLHYHRNDNNYDKWTVWFWEKGKDGKAISFVEEDGEMVATFPVSAGCQEVGYIVRYGDWEKKDVGEDQYIDVSSYLSGTIHYYVESGVKGGTIVDDPNAVVGVKVTSAIYKKGVIEVNTSRAFEGNAAEVFKLTDKSGQVITSTISKIHDKCVLITPAEQLNEYGLYYVVYDEVNYKVNIPSSYSTDEFESKYTYTGNDLGATWSKEATSFKLWAPTALEAYVCLYKSGDEGKNDLIKEVAMTAAEQGTWTVKIDGDLNGTYYTYKVLLADTYVEAVDPYARTTGVNGKRGMVIDLASTNPTGWDQDKDPNYDLNSTDMIIYELHIRDLSTNVNSGITNRGKFLGLTETGTKTNGGVATGLDHIKELGITHIHLLPIYDFGSVDESKTYTAQFNWGYDPVNYNVPEGSYSTDASKGEVRVAELKQTVQVLHQNGISVIMDVVYNHVYNASEFCFNKLVPGYFSRIDENGTYSSGSGCGNDTASERSMVKKYIVDSVNYWADEYHIDGFRFDLVGLLDIETINEIVTTVHEKHPNVKFYGEGWSMSTVTTKDDVEMATMQNASKTPNFAYFSDTIRDGIRGSVFNNTEKGYVSGASNKTLTILSSLKGLPTWCKNPSQIINYASCHDNNTLIDRIALATPDSTREEQIMMNNLAAAIYLTAQGIPFMQAGEEFLRTKPGENGGYDNNSYASSDFVNSLKWNKLESKEYSDVFNYYKGLIAFRKAHAGLRMTTKMQVVDHITEFDNLDTNVIALQIKDAKAVGDINDSIILIYNPNTTDTEITLPEGKWNICINKTNAGTEVLATAEGKVKVEALSAMVLVNEEVASPAEPDDKKEDEPNKEDTPSNEKTDENGSLVKPIALSILCSLLLAAAIVYMLKKKKH